MTNRFAGYPAEITYNSGLNTLDLQQLSSFRIDPSANIIHQTQMGSVDRSASFIASAFPTITIETMDLATVLAAVSLTAGLPVEAGVYNLQHRQSGGIWYPTGDSQHVKFSSPLGFIEPQTIEAATEEQTEGAKLTMLHHTLWDGAEPTVDPLIRTATQNLTGMPVPAFNTQFFMGPISHNAAKVNGVKRFTYTAGFKTMKDIADGDYFPKTITIDERNPRLQFTATNAALAAGLSEFLRAAGTWIVYLQKGNNGGHRVPRATAEHISITFNTGVWRSEETSAQGTGDATSVYSAEIHDPPTINLATTIPI